MQDTNPNLDFKDYHNNRSRCQTSISIKMMEVYHNITLDLFRKIIGRLELRQAFLRP